MQNEITNPVVMKTKVLFFPILIALLFASCIKEGDFSELKHDFVIEGNFDPTLGIPVAKISANIGTLVNLFDTTGMVFFDNNGLLSFRYTYKTTQKLDEWSAADEAKHGRKLGAMVQHSYISGAEDIPLLPYFNLLDNYSVFFDSLMVSVSTDIKAYAFQTIEDYVQRGVNVSFDSINIIIECKDGYREQVPVLNSTDSVGITDILEGRKFIILDNYNFANLVNHIPQKVYYGVRMNIVLPWEVYLSVGDNYLDSLGVDSLVATIVADFNFPVNCSYRNIEYQDTTDLDLSETIGAELDTIEKYLTLNDHDNYIAFKAKNQIPIDMILNATLLDQNKQPIVTLFDEEHNTIHGAPIRPLAGTELWVSAGEKESSFKIPISFDLLKKMRDTRYVVFHIGSNTSTEGATNQHPSVAIQSQDKLDLRTYVVLSPHLSFSTSVDNPINN